MTQVLDLQRNGCTVMHKLERLAEVVQIKGSPPHGMAVRNFLNCHLPFFGVEPTAKVKSGNVNEGVRTSLAMSDQPRMQTGRRENIFQTGSDVAAVPVPHHS